MDEVLDLPPRPDFEGARALHENLTALRGRARACGLDRLVRFAHHLETVLDAFRSGRLGPDVQALHLLHRVGNHLTDLVSAARDGTDKGITKGGVEFPDAESQPQKRSIE